MPSTYSSLKVELMATGEKNNSWGDITNTNLGTALEEAITGSADVTFASANVTLTLTDTNTTQSARNLRLNCIGTTGGASRNLVVPAIEKQYIVNNACADAITVKNATGTGVTVPAGTSAIVYNNGTNVVDAVTFMSKLTLQGDSVANNLLIITDTNASGKSWGLGPSVGTVDPTIFALYDYTANQAASFFKTGASGYWAWYTNGSERMRLDSSGNLGVGTASLGRTLCVYGTDCWVRLSNASRSWLLGPSNGSPFQIYDETSGVSRFNIDASGNVTVNNNLYVLNVLNAGATITSGNGVSTGDVAIEVGSLRTGSGNCYIDLHATAATDYEARIIRNTGANGAFEIVNTGTGAVNFTQTASGVFTWNSNGSERVRLDASGQLGIGTTLPTAALHVKSANGYIKTETSSTTSKRAAISFLQNGTQMWDVGTDISGTNNQDFYIFDNVANAVRFTIGSTGNVSVFNTLYLGATSVQSLAADTTTLYARGTNIAFQDAGASTTKMYLSGTSGLLGIGNTNPAYRLDVTAHDTTNGYAARLRAPATGAAQTILQFTDTGATVEWGHIRAGSSGLVVSNASVFGIDIGGTSKFSLDSSGNVTSPNLPGAAGYKGAPSSTTTTTAAVSDIGKVIKLAAGITIPASVFAEGAMLSLYNNTSGALTITQGAGLTMYLQGTATTGNRTIPQRGFATIWFASATECVIGGVT